MKTDIDTCLKDIRDSWYYPRKESDDDLLETILRRHCENEAEVKMMMFIIWASFHKMRRRLDEVKRLEE